MSDGGFCHYCQKSPCECPEWVDGLREVEAGTEEKPAFCIKDDATADWYVAKLAAIDAETALLKAQYEAAVKRLQNDRESLEYQFGGQLEAYIKAKIEASDGRKKSLILPHGTCAFRTVAAKIALADVAAAEVFAIEDDETQHCFESRFLPLAYKQYAEEWLQKTGELLPGVEQVPARESFSIRFGKKGEAEAE